MICLALDTAGNACAACLYDSASDRVLAEKTEEIGKGHAERLMGLISEVLDEAKITYQQLDKIITTIGPGSFTGIRVGVATARGFGVGLGIPVVGVSNLEALMDECSRSREEEKAGKHAVLLTAGRGEIYALLDFDTPFSRAGKPFAAEVDAIVDLLSAHDDVTACGDGATSLDGSLACRDNRRQASISTVARIGAGRDDEGNRPEPLYLRKPDAQPQSGFAVERTG